MDENERATPDEPYKVGPFKPPLEHRFKKGNPSPNPRGRPPNKRKQQMMAHKIDDFAAMVTRVGSRTVPKQDGTEISLRENLYNSLMESAFNPEVPLAERRKAREFALKLDRECSQQVQDDRTAALLAAIEYKDRWEPVFHAARLKGNQVPKQLPHPGDVEICSDGTVKCLGPWTFGDQIRMEEQLKGLRITRRAIEMLVAAGEPTDPEIGKALRGLRRRFRKFNAELPPRMRISPP